MTSMKNSFVAEGEQKEKIALAIVESTSSRSAFHAKWVELFN